MRAGESAVEPIADRELVITRVFDAPARLLFEAWSKPEHLMQWFGPVGWPLTLCEVDFRKGGRYRSAMTGSSGQLLACGSMRSCSQRFCSGCWMFMYSHPIFPQ